MPAKKKPRRRKSMSSRPTISSQWVVKVRIGINQIVAESGHQAAPGDQMNHFDLAHPVRTLRVSIWRQFGQLCVAAADPGTRLQSVVWRMPLKSWDGWLNMPRLWSEHDEEWTCRICLLSVPKS